MRYEFSKVAKVMFLFFGDYSMAKIFYFLVIIVW